MNADSQLIFEAYKKIDPKDHRYPQPSKFQPGDTIIFKRYIDRKYVGNNRGYNQKEDWIRTEYKNVLGKVIDIKAYPNPLNKGIVPSYYYNIRIEDHRYPTINGDTRMVASYEIKRSKGMTTDDTKSIMDLTNI